MKKDWNSEDSVGTSFSVSSPKVSYRLVADDRAEAKGGIPRPAYRLVGGGSGGGHFGNNLAGVSLYGTTAPGAGPVPSDQFIFGRFRLLPAARTLLCVGHPVKLGSRTFDLLHLLLMARGALTSKERIFAHVWPNTRVDESNLRVQIALLRKILGPERHLIKTIPGRGYVFAEDAGGVAVEAVRNRIATARS